MAADAVPRSAQTLAPLRSGDRLTRDEFERRYQAMHDVKKAELIEGVVYMPSPVTTAGHGAPHAKLVTWLGVYEAHVPGVQIADNATVRLDWDNEPQPDALLRILPKCGGQTHDQDGYVTHGPEWAGEIASSRASYDLHDKKKAYRRNGVQEYLVWRVEDGAIDWFALRGGRYDTLPLDNESIYRSEVFPGLWLDIEALLSGDMRRVLDVLAQGLASSQHTDFAERMQSS